MNLFACGNATAAIYRVPSDATAVSDHTPHLLVGGSVDAAPTALAFAGGDVWVGHAYCLNVWRADMQADRISGLQGLPRGNVTHVRWHTGNTHPGTARPETAAAVPAWRASMCTPEGVVDKSGCRFDNSMVVDRYCVE